MKLIKNLYITNRFFYALTGVIILFILGFIIPIIYSVAKVATFLFLLLVIIDYLLLFLPKTLVSADRILPERFSNGDENRVDIEIRNHTNSQLSIELIDELPIPFQVRNFSLSRTLAVHDRQSISYTLIPYKRGYYHFGNIIIFVQKKIGLLTRRVIIQASITVATYPSFIQMRKYEMIAFSDYHRSYGMKKIRKIGHTMEFDQIKNYIIGDDVRHINWKATAKTQHLMVNQYQDEQSQSLYCIIDKGRVMRMPFHGMTLLDYAINTSLAISKIAIRKQDKAGIITCAHKVEDVVVAERRNAQMNLIMESLFHIKTGYKETDYGRLYATIKAKIKQRSLLIIYSNFETLDAMRRQKKYLVAMSRHHVVVVVFFKNATLQEITESESKSVIEIFDKAVAEKMEYEKKLIVEELHRYGIHTVLTLPQDLTIDTINKYLELKARGVL